MFNPAEYGSSNLKKQGFLALILGTCSLKAVQVGFG